jgi:hypothetical protein
VANKYLKYFIPVQKRFPRKEHKVSGRTNSLYRIEKLFDVVSLVAINGLP